jgi:hypothetical protein
MASFWQEPERCPTDNQRIEGSVTEVVTMENLLSDQLTKSFENHGGGSGTV